MPGVVKLTVRRLSDRTIIVKIRKSGVAPHVFAHTYATRDAATLAMDRVADTSLELVQKTVRPDEIAASQDEPNELPG